MCARHHADHSAAGSSVFTAQGSPWGPWWVCRSQGPNPASVDQNLQGGPWSLNFNKVLSGPCEDCSVAPNTGQAPCSELPALLLSCPLKCPPCVPSGGHRKGSKDRAHWTGQQPHEWPVPRLKIWKIALNCQARNC